MRTRWQRLLLSAGTGLCLGLLWYTDDPETGKSGSSATVSITIGIIVTLISLRACKVISDSEHEKILQTNASQCTESRRCAGKVHAQVPQPRKETNQP